MNQTLKETLTELPLETGADFLLLLPKALFRNKNTTLHTLDPPFQVTFQADKDFMA